MPIDEDVLDKKLYDKYIKGSEKSFEELYLKYKDKILYFIFNMIKNTQKAEDLMQEVFLYIVNNKSYNPKYSFKSYLYLIAKSKTINAINKETRRNKIDDMIARETQDIEDVEEIIFQKEAEKNLLKIIKLLKEDYQNIIYLIDFEKLSYKEVAKIMDKSESNIKVSVHRARKELKRELEKEEYNEYYRSNREPISITRMALVLALVLSLSIGVVYGAITLYKKYSNNGQFEYDVDMDITDFEYVNGFIYKKIYNYNDYLKYVKNTDLSAEVEETTFNDNFIIFITTDSENRNGLLLHDYKNEDGILQINLIKNENINDSKPVGTFVLINKEMDSKEIQIKRVSNDMSMSSYKDIKELPKDYNMEEAIKDNCLVVAMPEKKTYNKKILEDFINDVNNKRDAEIRMCQYDFTNGKILITDLKYISDKGKFIICDDYTRYFDNFRYDVCEIYSNEVIVKKSTSTNPPLEFYYIKDDKSEWNFGIY